MEFSKWDHCRLWANGHFLKFNVVANVKRLLQNSSRFLKSSKIYSKIYFSVPRLTSLPMVPLISAVMPIFASRGCSLQEVRVQIPSTVTTTTIATILVVLMVKIHHPHQLVAKKCMPIYSCSYAIKVCVNTVVEFYDVYIHHSFNYIFPSCHAQSVYHT